jgi:TolB protein
MIYKRKILLTLALFLACTGLSHAQLEIEIVKSEVDALPIAVVPFAWNSSRPAPANAVDAVISADLYRSGLFEPLARQDMIERPAAPVDVRFGTWRLLNTDALVIGQIEDASDTSYLARFWLFDVNTGEQLLAMQETIGVDNLRFGAHRIADRIFEALTGTPGAFATRIAFVIQTQIADRQSYELVVADADGFNQASIVTDDQPLMSPAWSPNGQQLAYVSFARGNSTIILQDVYTGANRTIASFKGINGAPAFSPDGSKLALTLSRTGNPEVFLLDLESGDFTQLTRHWAIDTEPVWTPDGREILFTSDRGGKPQIYSMPVTGGDARRITFRGENNAAADISPDGQFLATAFAIDNIYKIAIHDRKNERLRVLSDGDLDESPSFAPNGSMLLYAAKEQGQGVLYAVSADGNVRQKLVTSVGDVREPVWSPFDKQ